MARPRGYRPLPPEETVEVTVARIDERQQAMEGRLGRIENALWSLVVMFIIGVIVAVLNSGVTG